MSLPKEISRSGTQNHRPVFISPPPRNPGCFYRKHRPPHRPRQAPRPKTPCGPKSDFGTTPRRSWCASKEVLLAHIFPVTSPTPRWVTARPRRPPRGGPGLSRSKISAPWGVQSRLEPAITRSSPAWSLAANSRSSEKRVREIPTFFFLRLLSRATLLPASGSRPNYSHDFFR